MDIISSWWIPFFFLLSLSLTGLFRIYALKTSLVDIPNHRSSHANPTPRGGGVAIIISFFLGSLLLWQTGLVTVRSLCAVMGCGGLVALIGIIDDFYQLPARIRFFVHVIASAGTLFIIKELPTMPWVTGDVDLGGFGYLFAAISLVWLLNLYNFMDGIDGIAGVEAISVAGGAALILILNEGNDSHVQWLVLLVSATLGFLVWNWPPAKIFMGDACSGFIGFCLGIFAIITSTSEGINIWSWAILLGVFLVDASFTLFSRILRQERFYEAHRSHAYQILSRRLRSHKKVTMGVLFINLFWLFPLALLASRFPAWGFFFMMASFVPLAWGVVRIGAGTTNE